jgi:hypothetical protein
MLPTKRSAIALARGARTGVLSTLTSIAVKTASSAAVNVASRSRMRNRNRRPVVEVHEQVAGLLSQPRAGRVGGDGEQVHATGGVLDDEERIQSAQGNGLEVEQVAGQDHVRLRSQELRPARPSSSW